MDTDGTGEPQADVTRILADVSAGKPEADGELLQAVYDQLHRIAATKLAVERPGHTLQPTALVNEAYLRLLGGTPEYRGRGHFFSAAAVAMRRILVDHARRRMADKRGGGVQAVTLHPELAGTGDPLERIVAVHEALESFGREHERQAKVVELLFFAGLSMDEAAQVMDVSSRTIKRDWRFARAWLFRAIGEDAAG